MTHIGVIRELEECGYVISSIVGCSMGALLGGFHAAGKLDAYETWVTKLSEWDVLRFVDVSLTSRSGMMKGDLIMDELRTLVGDMAIEDLPLRFTAVATDVVNHKEVWLSRGDLFDTMQTAISRYRLASYPPDILIDIPWNVCKTHEFYRAEQLIEADHYWAREYLRR